MKKLIITLLIMIMASTSAIAEQQVEDIYEDLLNINQHFFQSATVPSVDVVETTKKQKELRINEDSLYAEPPNGIILGGHGHSEQFVNHMPYFKKTRLKLMRAYQNKVQMHDEKLMQKQKEQQNIEAQNTTDTSPQNDVNSSNVDKQVKGTEQVQPESSSFVGGVTTQVTKTEMQLDCDEVKVNEETGELEALGHPEIYIPENNIRVTADKMLYDNEANILKAIGNVVIIKDGTPIYGDFLRVNLNEENILMENLKTATMTMRLNAKKGENENGITTTYNGTLYSPKSNIFRLKSSFVGPDAGMILNNNDRSYLLTKPDNKLKIDASEIYVDAGKYHEMYKIKDAEVFKNNKYLFTIPSFVAYTNKEHTYFESNYPEFGSISNLGMFAGPGWVVKGPYGSIFKLIPFLNYNSKFGFGGAVKFKSAFNNTEVMYGSSMNIFVASGRQYFDDKLYLDYVANSYMDDWFLGGRMPTYAAALTYDDTCVIPNMLSTGRNLVYSHRASATIAQDGTHNSNRENIIGSKTVTPRFRYMAQAVQNLYTYANPKNRTVFNLSLVMQGSAAVYGTGDTQVIGRIAPRIHTQYKNWMQDISYFITGYSDQTPMPVFDQYRYGHSNLYIREALRLHKYLSIGWVGSISLLKDSPNGEMFQENAFILAIGPDDCKFNIGYDIMRERTYFSVAVAFDTKNTTINYDKMIIKDIENLGKTNSDDRELSFQQEKQPVATAKNLQYAQVINIEDPNKESI